MPRRTAEASKAIRLAWQRECELIQEGKGTRDWTEDQQKDILNPEIGKAYDEDGKAFEGHHMKSAEAYPEYQGNSENIQFLSRTEHTRAHGGWQKPTNGYFDYTTGITHDFGKDELVPCKIIELSNPVITIDSYSINTAVESVDQAEKEQSSGVDPPIKGSKQPVVNAPVHRAAKNSHNNPVSKGNVISGIKNVANAAKEFSEKHPVLTTVVEVGIGIVVTATAGKVIDTKRRTKSSGGRGHRLPSSRILKTATETVVETISKFDFKKSESVLKQLGYTVAKSVGLSNIDRQEILQKIITSGEMSKEAICAFLESNINLHKNQSTFTEAVSKWTADLAYVRDKL